MRAPALFLFSVFFWTISFCAEGGNWRKITSQYVTMYYDKDIAPESINDKLHISDNVLRAYKRSITKQGTVEQIKSKLDTVFLRAQTILNMYPPGLSVEIRVYASDKELLNYYRKIYGRDYVNAKGDADVLSFYRFKENTIYIYVSHLRTSVMAHEMAHCVIDHYFIVLPPVKVQEILAMYVDKHFADV